MKAWLYPDRKQEEIGATRFLLSAYMVRPEALGKDDIDMDNDIIEKNWGFKTKPEAEKFAIKILSRDDLAFGAVTTQEQIVDWFVKEDLIAEWKNVGESEEITA